LKIKLYSLNPKETELIVSNNQQEERIDIHSEQIAKILQRLSKLEDKNQQRKSMEF